MRHQGGGAIVNVSSISAWVAQPNRWTYNTAKGAVTQLTRCAALDLASYKIRVNSVSPLVNAISISMLGVEAGTRWSKWLTLNHTPAFIA
jgi:NAD(P)-dependent dehydrogenase (short-subunit alcohol dehydrogenase family)